MNHNLKTLLAAILLCTSAGCDYVPCDCKSYNEMEEYLKNVDSNSMTSDYATLLQEAAVLNEALASRELLLSKIPSVKTRILARESLKKPQEEINSGHDYSLVMKKLADMQEQIEAKCAWRGFVKINFSIQKNMNVRSFEDIDGTLKGKKTECIHEVLHDTKFDIENAFLEVQHTFFIRNPKGVPPKIEPPTRIPEPIAVKTALNQFQASLKGACGEPSPGVLQLEFKINETGTPYDINVLKNSLPDEETKNCIIKKLETAELTPFPVKQQPPVRYSFTNG